MRFSAFLTLGTFAFALTACGGKVIVDGFHEGVGGAGGGGVGGAGGAPTVTSSSSSTVVSSTVSSTSSGAVCPAELAISAACDVEGMTCPVPLSCCGSAVCTNGFWKYSFLPCNVACTGPCGPDQFACVAGAVCVAYIGKSTTYECRQKPCPGPLACGCASPLCAEQEMVCSNIQDGYKVLCDCKGQC